MYIDRTKNVAQGIRNPKGNIIGYVRYSVSIHGHLHMYHTKKNLFSDMEQENWNRGVDTAQHNLMNAYHVVKCHRVT